MTRWDHRLVEIPYGPGEESYELGTLGREGWEAVSVHEQVADERFPLHPCVLLVLMKRRRRTRGRSQAMPETPDFDQIAREILVCNYSESDVAAIAEQLRLIWNARGAADQDAIESEMTTNAFVIDVFPYRRTIDGAIRELDR